MKKYLVIISVIVCFPLFAELGVSFIDVGQADSIVINADGHWAIIDGGNTGTSSKLYSYINNTLHVSSFELIVLTHPDKDHVGGLAGAIQGKVTKETVVWSYGSSADRYYSSFENYVNSSGSEITCPNPEDLFYLGSAIVTVIGPLKDSGNKNDNSLVIRIEYKGKSFLFMGDASWKAENLLWTKYATPNDFGNGFDSPLLNADVLKVGHHGSKESSTIVFLECVNPSIAVICSGNQYGHPAEETLRKLIQNETAIFRTDYHGTITITVSDTGFLSVSTQFNNNQPWFDEDLLSPWQKKQKGLI